MTPAGFSLVHTEFSIGVRVACSMAVNGSSGLTIQPELI
jgi:hypothetical protein